MTHSHRGNALEEHFRWYQELLLRGAPYSAAVALVEIFHGSAGLPAKQRAAWQSRVKKELTEKLLQEVRIGLERDIQRIRRILSVGSKWTGEEISLLMQKRIEIELLSDFLGIDAAVPSLMHLNQIDDQLSTLAKSKNHSRHFRSELLQRKKLAVFDIERIWLRLLTSPAQPG